MPKHLQGVVNTLRHAGERGQFKLTGKLTAVFAEPLYSALRADTCTVKHSLKIRTLHLLLDEKND